MLSKRFIIAAFGILMLLASLAYLFWEESREPKPDYSRLISEMRLNKKVHEKGLSGFVLVEPLSIHHIGDPITVRFGIIYDPLRWEIDENMFHTAIPLPGKFEIHDRQVYITKREGLAIIEAALLVQCLVCREGVENVALSFTEFLAKDKATGAASAITLSGSSNGRMEFAPLTNRTYTVDNTLVRLSVYDDHRIRVPLLVLAGVCLLIAVGLFLYTVLVARNRRPESIDEDPEDSIFSQVEALWQAFQMPGKDTGDAGHSLYRLLLAYRVEYGDADGKVADILEKLGVVYGKVGISEESLRELFGQVEILMLQGEV